MAWVPAVAPHIHKLEVVERRSDLVEENAGKHDFGGVDVCDANSKVSERANARPAEEVDDPREVDVGSTVVNVESEACEGELEIEGRC